MNRTRHKAYTLARVLMGTIILAPFSIIDAQSRQIKVAVEFQQSGNRSQESVQGSRSVIIRKDRVRPSARIGAGRGETTVQRSSGIFTLVQDGGESILTVTTRVPYAQIAF